MNRSIAALWRTAIQGSLLLLAAFSAPAGAQLVDITNQPLFASRPAHPNVSVTSSVEFPTVGSAYLNIGYTPASTYLGYFNPTTCYDFSGNQVGGTGYFKPKGTTNVNHECSDAFSGNFMNWATMSAIDEFRYAMTGGNRVDETMSSGTILQRATLPDGSVSGVPSFYNASSNFPSRIVVNASTVLPTGLTVYGTVLVNNCGNYVYFSLAGGVAGTCNIAANTHPYLTPAIGIFPVRVLVCDSTEGPVRTDLCLQYGGTNGKYRPVGQVQINAAQMRFASFGYLMDRTTTGYTVPSGCADNTGWSRCRYGGVLRSPMKYVGPYKYDANQNASVNAQKEINDDGTLVTDPEGTASSAGGTYSGFINFINKFGSSGVYKRYDPAGEMYYEAVRYYQGLQPTDLAATGNYNNAVKDFFPITTTWTDPILSVCASNFIINVSDANTWDDTYLPGTPGASQGPGYNRPASRAIDATGLDAYGWLSRIGQLESDTGIPSIATNDKRTELGTLVKANTANAASYAMAGAAYWANNNDIRGRPAPQKPMTIQTFSVDVAEGSIDVPLRQLYLLGKYGGFKNNGDRSTDTFAEPFYTADPANASNPAIRSNLEWADSTGAPTNYLLASNPQKLINGIRAAFASFGDPSGTLGGAALTASTLAYGNSGAYIATFNPKFWSGTILSKTLTVSNGQIAVGTGTNWSSGDLLTTRCGVGSAGPPATAAPTTCQDTDTSTNKRNIVTTVMSGSTRVAKPFTWANVMADSQYALVLNTNPTTNANDGNGQARLNYLRGYRGDETSALGFRIRSSPQGDIINSGPVYVGGPTTTISDADYQTFFNTNAARPPAVYSGSNDGMMHAFDAGSGQELFAYIPNFVSYDLNDLTNPGYTHEPFVDAVPVISEAKVNGNWATVLVSGVGNGAQGVFALDVTNPSTFGAGNVIFEFSDADDSDLGNVMSSPVIVKLQTGTSGTPAVPTYGYFAVVTGYNNKRTTKNGRTDASVSTDTTNRGVLFLLSLDRTLGTPWVPGSNYYKYYFPASDTTVANGLGPATPFQNRNGNGSTSALYFGDLQGNMWRFNTLGLPSAWTPSIGSVTSPTPFFVAKDASNNRQPITARPQLATGPYNSELVFFGTGRYLGYTDLSTPFAQQSEYTLLDNNQGAAISRSDLAARTGVVSGSGSNTIVSVTGAPFVYSGPSSKKGWYLDFPSTASGERSVTQPSVSVGLLSFVSLTLASDVCGTGGGFIYQLNALTGLPYPDTSNNALPGGQISTVGIPGPPRVVDITITAGQQRATGEIISQRTSATLVSGTSSNIAGVGSIATKAPPVGRVTWREITNYNDRRTP